MTKSIFKIAFILILLSPYLTGQGDTLSISSTTDFEINGIGDDEHWSLTDWVTVTQRTNKSRKYNTRAKVLYSVTGIYFLFECEDTHIGATINQDFGDLYNEDVVEVFLWTDENYPFYFEYELSPSNYELPIFVPNVDGDFFGWRPWHYEGDRKTKHATFITSEGSDVKSWTAEFFIPYALLKPMTNVPPSPGTTWRANMYRLDYDYGQTRWTWQPIRTNFHDFERFGTFLFE